MLQKILVPLDGSEVAERAIPTALEIGKKAEAEVVFLRVLETEDILIPDHLAMPMPMPPQWVEDFYKKASYYLEDIENRVDQRGLTLTSRIVEGDPAAVVVDIADEEEFDLIVMSSHGYSGLQRWILGSVTEKVLRHATCPVFVVRSVEPIEHILVALDGSPISEAVLDISYELARLLNVEMILMRSEPGLIVQNMRDIEQIERLDPGMGQRIVEQLYHRVEHYLTQVKIRYNHTDIPVRILPADGDPAGEILRYAKKLDNALIAMSTHGRDGLKRWRYGSVTEKVLRHTDRNMLVVRPTID